jgi:transposase
MSTRFRQVDRETLFLLPPSMDDWLPKEHLARFIVEIVAQLDLTAIKAAYAGRGSKAHHPEMLLALLFYGYATGVFSSRKLERATFDSVAFRYIAANDHPDDDTIATFRKRFLPELTPLFVQILLIAREMGFLKLGKVSLDGTKIKANASKHRALSWEHACKLEAQLKAEVEELLRQAEEADRSDLPDGLDIPAELARREERLAAIAQAKAEIERRAAERHTEEQAAYEEKLAERQTKEQKSGKKARGKQPKAPVEGPRDKDQVNLTDEESRIMPVSGGGFEQCYNAQASVDVETLLILAGISARIPTTSWKSSRPWRLWMLCRKIWALSTPYWPMPVITAKPMSATA